MITHKAMVKRLEDKFYRLRRGNSFHKGQNVNLVVGYTDGTFQVNRGTICHAGMSRIDPEKTPYILLSGLQNMRSDGRFDKLKKIEVALYYDWLFTRSLWSKCFYTKSCTQALKRGYVIGKASVPANLLVSAFIASRQPWERPQFVKSFYQFANNGASGHLAFLLAAVFSVDKNGTIRKNFVCSNHFPMDVSNMSINNARAFANGKIPNKTALERPYSKIKRYHRVNILMGLGASDRGRNAVSELNKIYNSCVSKRQASNNPFHQNNGTRFVTKENMEEFIYKIKEFIYGNQ